MQARATAQDLSPLFPGELDVSENLVHVVFRNHRAKLRGRIQGVPCLHPGGFGHQRVAKLLVDGPLDQDARTTQANLSLVRKGTADGGAQSFLEVGVGEHNGRVLATQFQAHLLEFRGDVARDPGACGRASREGDCRDVVVQHQRLTDLCTKAVQDVEHPWGKPCFGHPRAQHVRRDRGEF